MSEFSDLLSLFIKTRDINVSTLTSYCDLDRSTMYKLINGKRTPSSKELVQKLAAFMNLNPVETQELVESYRLTKAGWDTYYRRKSVLEFILNFAGMTGESIFPSSLSSSFSDFRFFPKDSFADSTSLTGQLQLSSAIHKILFEAVSNPGGTISFFAQPEHLDSLNIAASLPDCHTNIKIQHILCINNSKSFVKSQQNYNIQCLKNMIPFYGTAFDYQPYYYYDNVNSHFNNLNFMPCLFLTDKAAILCSSDLKEGILLENKGILNLFHKRFQDILKKTTPLTLNFALELQLQWKNMADVYTECSCIYELSAEPCLLPVFTPDFIEKYAEKSIPQRDVFIADFKKYVRTFPSSRLHLRFTKDGVMNFLMTGKLHEIPEHLYRPADFSDRIKLLQRLADLIEGSWDIRLLKGPLEKFPLNLHLFSASNYGYIMFSRPNSELSYILLREQNILSSFYDFASSLEENDYLETKEETLKFLRTVIQENASAAAERV